MSGPPNLSDRPLPEDSTLKQVIWYLNRQVVPFIRRLRTTASIIIDYIQPGDDGDVLKTVDDEVQWGQVINANVADDADIVVSKLAGGTEGYVIRTVGGVPTWVTFPQGVVQLTGASNTFTLAHLDNFVTIAHGSATQAMVPKNATTAFPIGSVIQGAQYGAGQLEIVADTGVTIRTDETLFLRKQNSSFALVKILTDEWILFGDLRLA